RQTGRTARPRTHLRRRCLRRAGGATHAFNRRAGGGPHGPAGRGPIVPAGAVATRDRDGPRRGLEASRRRAIARARLPREPVGPPATAASHRRGTLAQRPRGGPSGPTAPPALPARLAICVGAAGDGTRGV